MAGTFIPENSVIIYLHTMNKTKGTYFTGIQRLFWVWNIYSKKQRITVSRNIFNTKSWGIRLSHFWQFSGNLLTAWFSKIGLFKFPSQIFAMKPYNSVLPPPPDFTKITLKFLHETNSKKVLGWQKRGDSIDNLKMEHWTKSSLDAPGIFWLKITTAF